MASRGWGKNKKGHLVNSEGKTARQVKQEKYAAKKAEAKAKASGGGGADDDFDFAGAEEAIKSQPKKRGLIKQGLKHKPTPEEEARADALFGKRKERAAKANTGKAETTAKAQQAKPKRGTTKREVKNREMSPEEKERFDALFGKEGRAAVKAKSKEVKDLLQKEAEYKKKNPMSDYTDVGTLKYRYIDEISIKNPKKFNEAKLNEATELIKKAGFNYDPVILKETGRDRYEVIGNAFVYEAAKRAGIERINTIVGDEKAERNLKASRDDEPDTLTTGPKYDPDKHRTRDGKGMMEYSDIGTLKYTYLDEIAVKPTQRVNPKKVAEAAKRFKEEGRNWEPVILKETGPDSYEIIGNAHLYEAAKQAGFDRLWTVIGDNNTKEHKLGGKGKRKR